jgi:[acyl-carrier-protein] S-malonyltransferase
MDGTQVIMFPGLGATYPRMVEKYLGAHPADADVLAHWSVVIGAPLLATLGAVAARDARESERMRQMEIHALNLLWWRRIAREVRGAALCGHSLGYYAALVAAGVIDEDTSFRLINTVFAAGWRAFGSSDNTIFVVTAKTDYDFERLLRDVSVEVLSENSQLQRVMYGSRTQYQQVLGRLNGLLLSSTELGSRVPFHARCMQDPRAEVTAELADLGIVTGPLRSPLWSHITARRVLNSKQAFALVPEQLDQPVRWHRLVNALIQAGYHEFIEVGPNRVLSQTVRWICPQLDVRFVDHLRRQASGVAV